MNRPLVQLLILLAVSGLVFANTFSNGFHWDDHVRVLDNPGVTEFWPPWRHFFDPSTCANDTRLVQYRPLLPLSLSISHALSGDSLAGYHAGNLLLHVLAAGMVFWLCRELLVHWSKRESSPHLPLLIALLFAVHPVSGITVNYITARDLPLMQCGMLASLTLYARMRRLGETGPRWAACLGLFLLALLAKKNAVALPGIVVLFELFVARQGLGAATLRRAAPFVGVVLGLLAFIQFGLGFADAGNVVTTRFTSPGEYLAGQLQHHVFHYLPHFVWPFPIRLQPDWTHVGWQVFLGGAVIVGSWVLAWRVRGKHPLFAFGLLAYQGMLLLTSSVLPLIAEIVPYRPYPSGAFLWLAVGAMLLPLRQAPIVLGAFVVWFGGCSFVMNGVWKDDVTLWTHSIEYGGNDRAYVALARLTTGDKEKRAALYRKAIELNPENGDAQTELAQSSGDLNTLAKAVRDYPQSAGHRVTYAQGLANANRKGEALAQLQAALKLDHNHMEARWLAAMLLVETNQSQAALQVIGPLVERSPKYRTTLLIAATALFNTRQPDRALPLLERYTKLHPEHDQGWLNLGMALLNMGRPKDAIAPLQRCLKANDKFKQAYALLARAHRESGNVAEANRLMQIHNSLR